MVVMMMMMMMMMMVSLVTTPLKKRGGKSKWGSPLTTLAGSMESGSVGKELQEVPAFPALAKKEEKEKD
eukprot:2008072-Karenia_brevis.AAC.1